MKFATTVALLAATTQALDSGWGPTFSVAKDSDATKQVWTVEVPANKYLIIAFGEAHDEKVDMMYFAGKSSDNCWDMHGKEGTIPTRDAADKRNLECTVTGSGPYKFTVKRKLNTGDATSPDKVLECGKTLEIEYMGSDTTAELQATPTKHGAANYALDASCVATLTKKEEKKDSAMSKIIGAASVLAATYSLF
mgnify:CR=1 FL=1